MARVRVLSAHEVPQRPPIRVAAGQHVEVGERDTTWPAFVFITTEDGSGWVPSRHIDTSSDPPVMLAPYDTTELPARAGDMLTVLVHDELSGWTWVRDSRGQEGWVPDSAIELAEGESVQGESAEVEPAEDGSA
jgi:SH3 domain